jgi:hypothetical protein
LEFNCRTIKVVNDFKKKSKSYESEKIMTNPRIKIEQGAPFGA